MRIKSICLKWFRGAADEICLETKDKSVVIYGANGAGKSCFADALEYITHDSRVGHLSHEYSGKKQEKALSNTSIPSDQCATVRLVLADDTQLEVEIDSKGNSTFAGVPSDDPREWNYRRTILRQDEVSHFISQTKTDKYSALVPLLGLEGLEITAANFRNLAKRVEQESGVKLQNSYIAGVAGRRAEVESTETLDRQIDALHSRYCEGSATEDFASKATEVFQAVLRKIQHSSREQRCHVILQQIASLETLADAEIIRRCNGELVSSLETHVEQRIGILENIMTLLGASADENLLCPACGTELSAADFRRHVDDEERRLRELSVLFAERRMAIGRLCDTLTTLKNTLRSGDIEDWRTELDQTHLENVEKLDIQALRQRWDEEDLVSVLVSAQTIIKSAKDAELNAPADSSKLAADHKIAELAVEVSRAVAAHTDVLAVEQLLKLLKDTEQSIRDQIRESSQSIMTAISTDVQSFWGILHPDVPIEAVRLHVPDADKAIDIHLKFYGKEQDSPRLTLSEGFRNSLGLCIFLAMVKHEAQPDRPLILDDVIVSLDRDHRGMVAELLEQEFREYQVIILTHDREWYSELKYLLDQNRWIRKELSPYSTPSDGIRWANTQTTFAAARAHLHARPDSAANDARKIMDTELSMLAEKLKLKLQFVRGDRNDQRMAHEFLEGIISLAKKSLLTNIGGSYAAHQTAIDALEKADPYLLAWGNRGSHSFSLTESEARKLIDICETAIGVFACASCKRNIWYLANDKFMQCECGQIRWKF
jgi:energy-coupling factor transporter ATP-binding protein EcfA2